MPIANKVTVKKALKKTTSSTVFVMERRIATKDTLFPEKVAEAKKILRNAKFIDLRFGA